MKWTESLWNRVLNIIRRHRDHMKFAAYMAVWFIIFFHILLVPFCITVYMVVFCVLLFNCVSYVFLLLRCYVMYTYYYIMYSYWQVMYSCFIVMCYIVILFIFMYSYCFVYVFLLLCLCILIVVYHCIYGLSFVYFRLIL